jgi:hypothetical protein
MPPFTRLARVARLATLPQTRRLVVAAARSDAIHRLAHRAVHDRPALVHDLRDPANARTLIRSAVLSPATAELVNAGLLFVPGRYLPLGWAATWTAKRILRRYARRHRPSGRP